MVCGRYLLLLHYCLGWRPRIELAGQTPEYYALLTDAFLAGQTSLLVQPPAELLALPNPYDPIRNGEFRLQDASLYHGKYYLYFGPTPALVHSSGSVRPSFYVMVGSRAR